MEHLSHSRIEHDRDCVIVVGSPDVCRRIAHTASGQHVLTFSSLEELDRWRSRRIAGDTIAPDIGAVLKAIRCVPTALPKKLREAIETLSCEPSVPPLATLERQWPSRRSFYRTWSEHVAVPPSAFLRLVQAEHARRLLHRGLSRKEAALMAGYSSVDQMRRHLGK